MTSKKVSLRFDLEKDTDLIKYMDNSAMSNNTFVKTLMRQALSNNYELLMKSGVFKVGTDPRSESKSVKYAPKNTQKTQKDTKKTQKDFKKSHNGNDNRGESIIGNLPSK